MRARLFPFLFLIAIGANAARSIQPRRIAFEARLGEYVARASGYSLAITPRGADLQASGRTLSLRLENSSPKARLHGLDAMPGRANYFAGRRAAESYALFGRVRASEIYPGIDMLFHANQDHLEYDFELAAGADPRVIALDFSGADNVTLAKNGDLLVKLGAIELKQPKPRATQSGAPVDVSYRLLTGNRVAFRVGPHDRARPLLIDPELLFSNSFGAGDSSGSAIALDKQGNIYVTGAISTGAIPAVNAAQRNPGAPPLLSSSDGGVTWTAPAVLGTGGVAAMAESPSDPETVYAATPTGILKSVDGAVTWTRPANNGWPSQVRGISVDAGSEYTIYAASYSSGVFTSRDGGDSWTGSIKGLQDPTQGGALSTLQGVYADPLQPARVFALGREPYLSTDFGQTWTIVTLPGSIYPNILVFNPEDPQELYAAGLGGISVSKDRGITWSLVSQQQVEAPLGLAVLPGNSSILLAGAVNEVDRSTDGGLTWSRVLGLAGASVVADPKNPGYVYAAGRAGFYTSVDSGATWSLRLVPSEVWPVTLLATSAGKLLVGNASQNDAFVTKWSPDGSQILYSTYLGGSSYDLATGIAVDGTGNAYVTGSTQSTDYPVTAGAYQTKLPTLPGSFVTKLSTDGSRLVYSTLIPTNSGVQIAVDAAGQSWITGTTTGSGFPVTPDAFQTQPAAVCTLQLPYANSPGLSDAFLAKLSADGSSLLYSTLLGGDCSNGAHAIAIDANGDIWIGGETSAQNFPVTSDALQPQPGVSPSDPKFYVPYDGFLARFDPSGALKYATYLGGHGYDEAAGIAFGPKGELFVMGGTNGLSQPLSPGAYATQASPGCPSFSPGPPVYTPGGSAFIMKLDAAAHNVLALTYDPSPNCLVPNAIAVDPSGNPWIAGSSGIQPPGSWMPTVAPFTIGLGGGYVSEFSTDLTQLTFSTEFSASNGLAISPMGVVYAVGYNPVLAAIDPKPDAVQLDSIVNPVDSYGVGVGPGEVVHLTGRNLGPAQPTPGIVNGGVLATSVAGVHVTFDGVPVPLLSVSANEIDLVGPFELAGKSTTTIQVEYNGVKSKAVRTVVFGRPIQILGVFNSDFSVNSAQDPAKPGSLMVLYLSGIGQTSPPSQDGQINQPPLANPPGAVVMDHSPVLYFGAAPGLPAGIFQVNFLAPPPESSYETLTVAATNATFYAFVSAAP